MKKIFSLVCLLLLTTVLLVGCGSEKKKLVIGLDDHFPPMGFRDDKNNLVGFDIDVGNDPDHILILLDVIKKRLIPRFPDLFGRF